MNQTASRLQASGHINFYGTYHFDLESELRRQGQRPLRSPAA
jgi:hypothetical protein